MTSSAQGAVLGAHNPLLSDDTALLPGLVAAVQATGESLLARFSTAPAQFGTISDVLAAIQANDAAALEVLRPALERLRPQAQWAEDEEGGGPLPPGEWWVTDPVEGNVNHIHGMSDWAVSATLVRDNVPVLCAVHLPLPHFSAPQGTTYTAVLGGGAFQDQTRLRTSAKSALGAALVATSQARPGEDAQTLQQIGRSVTALLKHSLVVRVLVPSTLQQIQVAAGRLDLFWQHSQVRSGLLAGALLVSEAGGAVTDTHGLPWTLKSADFLACAAGLHAPALQVFADLR